MAITFSQEIFEKICSSATNSTAEVYDMIAPHLDDTLQSINCVLLGDMADKLDTVPGLEQAVTKLVCLRTYQEQIPQLDLVLTPTGFGVVSNQNLAPASADRVKNLLLQVTNAVLRPHPRTGPAQCIHQRRVCHGRLHVQVHRLLHRKELAGSKEHAGTHRELRGIQGRGIRQLQGLRSLQSQTFPDLSE